MNRAHEAHVTAILTVNGADLLRHLQRRAPQDAADLLGEVMATTWRRVADVPADELEARLWLFGVARHTLANHERGQVRRLRLAEQLRARLAVQTPATHESRAVVGSEVRDAVDRLPVDLAELVRLVHWDGFTLTEAAHIVGLNPSTARSRYARARAELRTALTLSVD